ncbi:MAG: HEAT repeat domain-containing protein [Candidatus Zixiibacteriota bacterium]
MFPFWDVVSIAFLGGILVLKRVRDRWHAAEHLRWPMPVSPTPSGEDGGPWPVKTIPPASPSPEITKGIDVGTTSALSIDPAPEAQMCQMDAAAPRPSTAAWLNDELNVPSFIPEHEPASPAADHSTGVTFIAETTNPQAPASVELSSGPETAEECRGSEPVLTPEVEAVPAAGHAPAALSVPVESTGKEPDAPSLEDQIQTLEAQMQATERELQQLECPPLVEAHLGPEKGKRKKNTRRRRSKACGAIDRKLMVPFANGGVASSERSMPIPGVPGEFSADQVLGLVQRLWDNRDSARPEVRQQVEEFLPRVVPSLLKVAECDTIPESIRYDAVLLLGNVRAQEAVPLLTKLVDDPLPAVRYASATALANFSADQSVVPLLNAFRDQNDLVRATAAQSLGKRCPTPALPALVRGLADHSRMVRLSARDAIQQYPIDELCTRIPFLLPRTPVKALGRALRVIASFESEARLPLFRDLLKSEHPRVLPRVVKVALKMGEPQLADELVDATRRLERFEPSMPIDPGPATAEASPTEAKSEPATIVPQTMAPPPTSIATSSTVSLATDSLMTIVSVTIADQIAVSEQNDSDDGSRDETTPVESTTGPVVTENSKPAFPDPEPAVQATVDMLSFIKQFRVSSAFEQIRLLRDLLETQSLNFEQLSGLYGYAAGPFIRSGILDALRSQGAIAEPFLLACLNEPEEETVLAAIKALADAGDGAAIERLGAFRRHPSSHVRFTTEIALEKIRSRQGKA